MAREQSSGGTYQDLIGPVMMTIVAGVNLSLVLTKFQQGDDPVGYANATILAMLWAFAMLWETHGVSADAA